MTATYVHNTYTEMLPRIYQTHILGPESSPLLIYREIKEVLERIDQPITK